jgi:hypothetical protein
MYVLDPKRDTWADLISDEQLDTCDQTMYRSRPYEHDERDITHFTLCTAVHRWA